MTEEFRSPSPFREALDARRRIEGLERGLEDDAIPPVELMPFTYPGVFDDTVSPPWRLSFGIRLLGVEVSFTTASSSGGVDLEVQVDGVAVVTETIAVSTDEADYDVDVDVAPQQRVTCQFTDPGTDTAGAVVMLLFERL